MSSGELTQITALIKSGNRAEAKRRLDILLKANPNSAQLWYLVAATMEGKQKQIAALNKALECDPTYEKAKIALSRIAPDQSSSSAPVEPKRRIRPAAVALVIALIALAIAYVLFSRSVDEGRRNAQAALNAVYTNSIAAWTIHEEKSELDGRLTIAISRFAMRGDTAILYIRCRQPDLEVFIGGLRQVDEDAPSYIRYDSGEIQTINMSVSTTGDDLFFPDHLAALHALLDHKEMVFAYTPLTGGRSESVFDLTGLIDQLGRIGSACRM